MPGAHTQWYVLLASTHTHLTGNITRRVTIATIDTGVTGATCLKIITRTLARHSTDIIVPTATLYRHKMCIHAWRILASNPWRLYNCGKCAGREGEWLCIVWRPARSRGTGTQTRGQVPIPASKGTGTQTVLVRTHTCAPAAVEVVVVEWTEIALSTNCLHSIITTNAGTGPSILLTQLTYITFTGWKIRFHYRPMRQHNLFQLTLQHLMKGQASLKCITDTVLATGVNQ